MHIRRLILENIRAIRSLELSFADHARPWTFLLGGNGVGKTTVLRAVALLTAGADALAELVGDTDRWIRHGEPSASISGDFIDETGEVTTITLRFERGDDISQFLARNTIDLEPLRGQRWPVFGYGVHRRAASSASTAGSYRTWSANAVATLFDPGALLHPLEAWAFDLDYRKSKRGLKLVRETLDAFLRDVDFVRIDKELRPPKLVFRTTDGEVHLSDLSDGYQSVAAWCGDLLYQITEVLERSETPLGIHGVLLLDELGLHLHPLWQRELIEFLKVRLPRMQMICTTHSPLTVHQARAGEVVVLRREDGDVVPRAFTGEPNKMFLHQLLASPLFQLDSLDSKMVEDLRDELESLRKTTRRDAKQQRRLEKVEAQLRTLPSYGSDGMQPAPDDDLLRRVVARLEEATG